MVERRDVNLPASERASTKGTLGVDIRVHAFMGDTIISMSTPCTPTGGILLAVLL
jgi:hypothetical protein